MGFEDCNISDDGDGKSHGSVPCSICLDNVTDIGVRSWAKLHCGHQFHLDCIGSAFNMKGVMQCPNCRKIEKGQWLFASNSRSSYPPELNMEDWAPDEDLYDLSYSEMGHGIHWCPFSGLSRLPVSFEEGEFSTAYHDLLGQHAIYAEHTTVSAGHPCPYVAYFGPVPPPSSNSSGNVPESSNFNTPWNGPSIPPFPGVGADVLYQYWDNHSTPFSSTSSRVVGGGDQPPVLSGSQRPGRANHDVPRSGAIMHPFLVGHSSGARPGNSAASPMIPPYPGSNARAHDRAQALQAYYQPVNPSPLPIRTPMVPDSRRSGHRVPSSDQTTSFYFPSGTPPSRIFQEGESTQLNPIRLPIWETEYSPSYAYHAVERDPSWGNYRQANVGSNSSSRPRRQNRS